MKLAEQNVISGLLTSDNVDFVYEMLEPQMFTDALLGKMFFILKEAYINKEPADLTYLSQRITEFPEELVEKNIKEIAYLLPIGLELKADVQTITGDYQARLVNQALSQTLINGFNVHDKTEEIITQLNDIIQVKNKGQTVPELVNEHQSGCFIPKENGISIGFTEIDADLGGLEKGDLIIIASRPAVGKTAFALQIIDNMAKHGNKVILFNLEMTEKQIYQRMLSRESGISLHRIRTAQKFMNDVEVIRFSFANEALMKRDNITVVTGGQEISDIRRICKTQKPDIIVIDYLQLVSPGDRYRGTRYAEVGEVSHGLKAIARDLDIPVLVLSQINRDSEKSKTKEPSMAEIRESGDVEQDASIIMLLWNDDENDFSKKRIKIEKNRQGSLGKYRLLFNGSELKFEEGGWETPKEDEDLPFEPDKG